MSPVTRLRRVPPPWLHCAEHPAAPIQRRLAPSRKTPTCWT